MIEFFKMPHQLMELKEKQTLRCFLKFIETATSGKTLNKTEIAGNVAEILSVI